MDEKELDTLEKVFRHIQTKDVVFQLGLTEGDMKTIERLIVKEKLKRG